jgi:putative ABC transport system permease protein
MTTIHLCVRGLRRSPWFSASVIAVLTIGIALATVVFAVVENALFRALPYQSPDELFVLRAEHSGTPLRELAPIAAPEVQEWSQALSEIPHTTLNTNLEELPVEGIPATLASIDARFFDVLGIAPLFGGFTADDFGGRDDGVDSRPVMLSHRLWQKWTGGDPDVLNRAWVVSERRGRRYSIRVAGVLPADFVYPFDTGREPPDLLAPMSRLDSDDPRRRYQMVFRVDPSQSMTAIGGRLEQATAHLAQVKLPTDPHGSHGEQKLAIPYDRTTLQSLGEWSAPRQRASYRLLFVTTIGLLLLACFNTAGLMLARNIERTGELTTLRTLGATVRHLAILQLMESAVVVGAASLLALLVAHPMLAATVGLLPDAFRFGAEPAITARVGAATLAFAVLSIVLIFAIQRTLVAKALHGLGRTDRPVRAGVTFIAVQVACGFAFLISGVLTLVSLGHAMTNESGYAEDRMILLEGSVRRFVSLDDARQQLDDSVTFIAGLPGIDRVAVSTIQANFLRPIIIPISLTPQGWSSPTDSAVVRQVSNGFFEVMGLTLVSGEWPSHNEWRSANIALISASAAKAFWPNGTAIGRSLHLNTSKSDYRVVGVVGDARFAGRDMKATLDVYLPNAIAQGRTGLLFHVRTSSVPEARLSFLLRELAAKGIRVDRYATHADGLYESIKDRVLPAWLFGGVAVAALVVLIVGVGGLLAMVSARRAREVGIRLALGSPVLDVFAALMREPVVSIMDGLFVGCLVSWWLVTFLDSQLYGVGSHHLGSWAVAIITLGAVSMAAAAVPVIRAVRVNPLETLRDL